MKSTYSINKTSNRRRSNTLREDHNSKLQSRLTRFQLAFARWPLPRPPSPHSRYESDNRGWWRNNTITWIFSTLWIFQPSSHRIGGSIMRLLYCHLLHPAFNWDILALHIYRLVKEHHVHLRLSNLLLLLLNRALVRVIFTKYCIVSPAHCERLIRSCHHEPLIELNGFCPRSSPKKKHTALTVLWASLLVSF